MQTGSAWDAANHETSGHQRTGRIRGMQKLFVLYHAKTDDKITDANNCSLDRLVSDPHRGKDAYIFNSRDIVFPDRLS